MNTAASNPTASPANAPLHLILGDGVIGQAVADELSRLRVPHALASRSPAAHPSPQRRVDALDRQALIVATAGVTHLYVTLGLRYDLRTWQRDWPIVIENVLAAARVQRLRVVFFDNVYAYGPAPLQLPMTEEHPRQPPSRKGAVRKALDERLLRAAAEEGVDLVIGRSADFYGPGVRNSMLYAAAMERQLAGKAAQWIGDPDRLHTYTYTIDAARALVRLAMDDGRHSGAGGAHGRDDPGAHEHGDARAYGLGDARAHGVWHLPTAEPAPTTRELLEQSARLLGAPPTIQTLPRPMVAALGLFVPILREVREMLYQNDSDYVFSSAKFMRRYPDFEITPYARGIEAMVASLRTAPSAAPAARAA